MKKKRPISLCTTLLASLAVISATFPTGATEPLPLVAGAKVYVAVDNVCAWPVLTKMRDGSIVASIHNEPSHGSEALI